MIDITIEEPRTEGPYRVEEQDDGSWALLGSDPQDGYYVLVAACETRQDCLHLQTIHNLYHLITK